MLALAARLLTTSDGPNFPDQFRRAADYADKILCGAQPGQYPGRTAYQVRTRHQSDDRQDAWLDDPRVVSPPGRSRTAATL